MIWLDGPINPTVRAPKLKRPKRHRHARVAAVIAVAGAVAGAVFVSTRPESPKPKRVADRMVPTVSTSGATTTMTVTMLDGRRYTVTYPATVDIAGLGLTMSTSMSWPVGPRTAQRQPCCDRTVSLSYTTVADLYPDAVPVAVYPGTHGTKVFLFHATQRRVPAAPYTTADELVFQFGSWVAEVWTAVPGSEATIEPMNTEQQRTWAANLQADARDDGTIVLHPNSPLHAGPPAENFVSFGDHTLIGATRLELTPFYCTDTNSQTDTRRRTIGPGSIATVAWCDATTGLFVGATGPATFTEPIATSLQLHAVAPR